MNNKKIKHRDTVATSDGCEIRIILNVYI